MRCASQWEMRRYFQLSFGYNDGCQYGGDALASDINAYTGGYFSGCIYLHYDHMRRYFAQVLYNILASILRALGNSKTPLYFLILAALLNIVLDLTFIIVFHMGVAGAAWATITAQGVSGVLCLIYIIKYVPELRLKADDWRFRSEIAKKKFLWAFPWDCSIPSLRSEP